MNADDVSRFGWDIPERFNLGATVCDHWVDNDPDQTAIIEVGDVWSCKQHSYTSLGRRSGQSSDLLAARGIGWHGRGRIADRVGVILPQSFEAAVAHIAVMRMGAISLPLSTLFGPEALLHRLRDSDASAIIVNAQCLGLLAEIASGLPELRLIVCKDLPKAAGSDLLGIELLTVQAGFRLMREFGVRNCFLPPTALKLMRLAPETGASGISLRSVPSGGEPLGVEFIEWGRRILGATINEFYGQTECNMTISCHATLREPVPGVMGFAMPGHCVAIIAPDTGEIAPDNCEGEIAVLAPVMFLRYWNNPEDTQRKFVAGSDGQCLMTGDRGRRRADGRFVFLGRDDDVISSAGYRIGPAEIEDCLIGHPAVRIAGVVG